MTVIAARPTTYSGVEMRSRTEARFAAFLDRAGIVWRYEPQAFASKSGQYLPDFELRFDGPRPLRRVYVDVKGREPDDLVPLLRRMTIIWDSRPTAVLAIAPADEPRQRLIVYLADHPQRLFEGFIGSCPAGHVGFGVMRGTVPWLACGCGYNGAPGLIARIWDQAA